MLISIPEGYDRHVLYSEWILWGVGYRFWVVRSEGQDIKVLWMYKKRQAKDMDV